MSGKKSNFHKSVAITTGEQKLLKKLTNFTKENLFVKNEEMLIREKKFKSFRPNSADCKLERAQTGDIEAIHNNCHHQPVRYSANAFNLSKNIKRSQTSIGFESSFLTTKVIENRNEFLKLDLDLVNVKLEKNLTLKILEKLRNEFEGKHEMELDEFKKIFKKLSQEIKTKEKEVERFFQRIDCFSSGFVTWKSLCSYMQLVCMKNCHSKDKEKDSFFKLPAKSILSPHRETLVKIIELKNDMVGHKDWSKSFVCCSKDGIISFWSMEGTKAKKSKRIVPSNSYKQKWVTDFEIMFQFYKIVLCTGDRELQFYDSSSLEPYCQITGFNSIPLRIDYCYTGDDSCLLSFGDLEGCVNVLILNTVRDSLRSWKVSLKEAGMPTVNVEKIVSPPYVQFHRWKAHLDWVQQVRFSPELGQLISCSENEKTALVIGSVEDKTQSDLPLQSGASSISATRTTSSERIAHVNFLTPKVRQRSHETVFSVSKGVKCFDVSKTRNYIITGGLDRNVRIWNPRMPGKPISTMKAHEAPITYVAVSDQEGKIFTISLDKCILVWDLLNHCMVLSCRPRSHRIVGDVQVCHYSVTGRCFIVATDTVNLIHRKFSPAENVDGSPSRPINAIVYNYLHKEIITACEASVITIWNIYNGLELFQFDASLNGHFITCLSLDDTCRRLFTGGSDGSICMWNYSNGELLRTLSPGPNLMCEILDVTHLVANDSKYLVSVGWSKQVTIYEDNTADYKQHTQPLPHWPDDLAKGHEDDIVCVTFCPCNLLVTSSCDGLIIVWNFISGHRICCMMTPSDLTIEKEGSDYLIEGRITKNKKEQEEEDDDDDVGCIGNNLEDMIPRVLLLTSRCNKPLTGNLVSLGSKGQVHFWNVNKGGGNHVTSFRNSSMDSLVVMATNSTNDMLALGNSQGFVNLWNISRFSLERKYSKNRPSLIASWRAHIHKVTCLQLAEEACGLFIITSSIDGCTRIWNDLGHFIGTFGIKGLWFLSEPSTYIHPRVPHDVLIHPLSLPTHPLVPTQPLTTEQVIFGDDGEGDENVTANDRNIEEASDILWNVEDKKLVDGILHNKKFINSAGKRLRYEMTKPNPPNTGIRTIYGRLKIHDLKPEPNQRYQILKRKSIDSWMCKNHEL